MHYLRQAKLAFHRVHLVVGPLSDTQLLAHAPDIPIVAQRSILIPHVERCEAIRHVRWVDSIVVDAPYVLSDSFLTRHHIDYVAIPEGTSVDPRIGKDRLSGYDLIRSLGKCNH